MPLKVDDCHKTFVASWLGTDVRCVVSVATFVVRSGTPPAESGGAESAVEFLSASCR